MEYKITPLQPRRFHSFRRVCPQRRRAKPDRLPRCNNVRFHRLRKLPL